MTDAELENTPAEPATPPASPDDGLALAGGGTAPDAERIEGIIAQVGYDYRGGDLEELAARLRQRFEQSEVPVDDADVARYAQQIVDSAS